MFTNIFVIGLIGVVAVKAGIIDNSQYQSWDWNSLLGSDSVLFPEEIQAIQSKSGDKAVIMGELKALLGQDGVAFTLYENFGKTFNKEMSNIETFKANLVKIAEHNLEARVGQHSWEMGVNQFTDMTYDEFAARYLGNNIDLQSLFNASSIPMQYTSAPPTAPRSKDWRAEKRVTPPKNQGNCGSCVAFSVTGTLEAAHAIAHNGQLLDLSEQQLIDCARGNGNNGCNGMTFVPTFDYIKAEGLSLESDYRYEAKDGSCRKKNSAAKAASWTAIKPQKDERVLADYVAKAPVAIAVHVNDGFMNYKSGIYGVTEKCEGGRNHAVGLVGYGVEGGKDFWIIKNSWSESWGDRGYIRLSRNNGNKCDVAGDTVYVVAK